MSKTLKVLLFSILVGTSLAFLFFFNIKEKAEAKDKPFLYAFQVGVFKNSQNASSFALEYPSSILLFDNEYYRVYIGVTKTNVSLFSSLFDQKGYQYYVKEMEVSQEVEQEIEKYDELWRQSHEENQEAILKRMLESVKDVL